MIVTLAVLGQLAAACAPTVAIETLAAIAWHESAMDDSVIYDNTTRRSYRPTSREEAINLATGLVVVQRHSVDLGLMQINSANLRRLGKTIAEAFEPCHNMAAGARILREGYAAALRTESDPQLALRIAFSRYNTGHPERGFSNGYVTRVQGAAEVVVPAIRLHGSLADGLRRPAPGFNPETPADPDAPPEWDVWAQATHQSRSGLVIVPHRPSAAPASAAETSPPPARTAE